MDVQLFLVLVAGHYLADYGLQTQFMDEKKRQIFLDSMGFHALTAHAFIHGLIAGLLSTSFTVGVVIAVTHWLIDFGRGSQWLMQKLSRKKGLYGIHVDQSLHILTILLVVLLVV